MVFEILLAIGLLGFIASTLLGFSRGHGGHHAHAHGLGHGAHGLSHGAAHGAHGGSHAGAHGAGHSGTQAHAGSHGAQAGHGTPAQGGQVRITDSGSVQSISPVHKAPIEESRGRGLWFIPSPIDIFSMAFGAGAVGVLVSPHADLNTTWMAAVAGAIVFNFGIVRPLFSLGLKFASVPSEGLEGSVAHEAEAITRFDESGKGIVQVLLDGQLVQLLARLEHEEHERGVAVSKGDSVVVTEIDPKAGTCRVSREMTP